MGPIMSISYSARVVCGFKLDVVTVFTEQTKYNEDTGEPYQVRVESHDVAYVDGKPVIDTIENPDVLCCGEEIDGMEIIESGYSGGVKILGDVLSRVGEYNDVCHIIDLTSNSAGVVAFSEKHGLTPKLFLVMSCG